MNEVFDNKESNALKSIYETYNRIFNCKGHGWTNLQSTHLNLPFANEDEFVRLHSAIRLLLPIIPALSASSPILDGKATGFVDTRLEYYRKNQQKIPIITGQVIPEAITSIAEYQEKILQPIYNTIAPYDNNNVLCFQKCYQNFSLGKNLEKSDMILFTPFFPLFLRPS